MLNNESYYFINRIVHLYKVLKFFISYLTVYLTIKKMEADSFYLLPFGKFSSHLKFKIHLPFSATQKAEKPVRECKFTQ